MTEAEELELLQLERERTMAQQPAADVTGRAYSSPMQPQQSEIEKARQERFQREPGWLQALIGIGAKSHETLVGPTQLAAAYITGGKEGYEAKKQELADIREKYEQASKGSFPAYAGELGTDIVETLAPGHIGGKIGKLRKAPGFIKGVVTGLGAGTGSAAVHQLQNIGRGGQVEPFGAAVETGVSALTGGVGSKVAPALEQTANKIIQTATRLGRRIKGQKTMSAKQAENYFENYAGWRNILSSEKKINAHHKQLSAKFDDLMENMAKGKQVDIKQATIDARNKLLDKASRGEVDILDVPKINKTIDEFEQMTNPLLDPKTGKIDFKVAQNFKKKTLDVRSKWDKPTPLGDTDPTLVGPAKAARATRRELTKAMGEEIPQYSQLNKEFSQMADIEPFIEQSVERFLGNRGFSPQDLATLAAGGLGVAGGAAFDKPGYGALIMLPFVISRAQRSPGVAKLFYQMSKGAKHKATKESAKLFSQMSRSQFDKWYKDKKQKMGKLLDKYEKTKDEKMKALIERNLEKELQTN